MTPIGPCKETNGIAHKLISWTFRQEYKRERIKVLLGR
jgi:hypothetical protein